MRIEGIIVGLSVPYHELDVVNKKRTTLNIKYSLFDGLLIFVAVIFCWKPGFRSHSPELKF